MLSTSALHDILGSFVIAVLCDCVGPQTRCTMATVSTLIKQLTEAPDYFGGQVGIMDPPIIEKHGNACAASIVCQIRRMSELDMPGATSMTSAIKNSAFPLSSQSLVADAIAQRVLEGAQTASAAPSARGKQSINEPHRFFTEGDVAYIADRTKVNEQVAARAVGRLALCGVTNLTEPAWGAVASSIACIRSADITAPGLHALVADCKRALRIDLPKGPFETCPATPAELRAKYPDYWNAAYASERPAGFESDAFRTILHRCPLRATHKAIRSKASAGSSTLALLDQPSSIVNMMQQSNERMLRSFIDTFVTQRPRTEGADIVIDEDAVRRQRALRDSGSAAGSKDKTADDALCTIKDQPAAGSKLKFSFDKSPADGADDAAALEHADDAPVMPKAGPADVEDVVRHLATLSGAKKAANRLAAASVPKSVLKKPSGAKTPLLTKAKSITKSALKKGPVPKSAPMKKPSAGKKPLKLGCGRCRGSRIGCLTCRSPAFTGVRFQREGSPMIGALCDMPMGGAGRCDGADLLQLHHCSMYRLVDI